MEEQTTPTRTHDDYTVAWVCALPKEQTAALAMLDCKHHHLEYPHNDPNTYTLGSIGPHNIVIVGLPLGKYGTNAAATVATQVTRTFPSIRFGLLVGIGGGIPSKVRLGDVVVGTPVYQYPGIVQWDLGKAEKDGKFKRTGALNNPPTALLTALSKMKAQVALEGSAMNRYLDSMFTKYPNLGREYAWSTALRDPLSLPDSDQCKTRWYNMFYWLWSTVWALILFLLGRTMVTSAAQDSSSPVGIQNNESEEGMKKINVHYGLIASGNQVIKDAKERDRIDAEWDGNVLCVEMEAAGLWDFPSIVIRGICDYANSGKNKSWQEYASAVAAAYAKELLGYVHPRQVNIERPMRESLANVMKGIESLEIKAKTEEERKILDWLTAVDYGPQQSDILMLRQPGTCKWFLDSGNYNTWVATKKRILFCPGIPGAGKTVVVSAVVDELTQKLRHDPGIGVAYIYCSSLRRDQQRISDLMASILKQLTEKQPTLPSAVRNLHYQHTKDRTKPALDEYLRTLENVVEMYSRVTILVDALDECQTVAGCRRKFMEELLNLYNKFGVNILATSRFIPDVVDRFGGFDTVEIHANTDDIKSYLKDNIDNLPIMRKDHRLYAEIEEGISEAAGGMFLLAIIYFNSLMDKFTLNDIRKALQQFRNQDLGSDEEDKVKILDQVYHQTMDRINSQAPGSRRLALKALAWAFHAKRPLNTWELRYALAIKTGHTALDEDDIPEIENIVLVCAGLITVDKTSDIVRLTHRTMEEYFEHRQSQWFPDGESEMTRLCVTYLLFNAFETGYCDSEHELEQRLELHKFYEYASKNWGHHARQAKKLGQEVYDLLGCQTKMVASIQSLLRFGPFPNYREDFEEHRYVPLHLFPGRMTKLHLAAYFGVEELVKNLLSASHQHVTDSYGLTPLAYAARNGHDLVVGLFLRIDGIQPDYNSKPSGRTPLSLAAEHGHSTVVKLLLQGGADVNSKSLAFPNDACEDLTPLSLAAAEGHKEVVELLLDHPDIDANSENKYYYTPLVFAAKRGKDAVVEVLVNHAKVNPNPQDEYFRTPLSHAAELGHNRVVELLLKHPNIYPDCPAMGFVYDGRTALSFAAEKGRLEAIRLLLSHPRVNPNYMDECCLTPLTWAALKGYLEAVELLLCHPKIKPGIDPDDGHTPLFRAAKDGHEKVFELLLRHSQGGLTIKGTIVSSEGCEDIDMNCKDRSGQTMLSIAAGKGYDRIVQLLLEDERVDITSRDHEGSTALLVALKNNKYATAELLLAKTNPDPVGTGKGKQTALRWAVHSGDDVVAEILLSHGRADIDIHYQHDQTSLWWIGAYGNQAILKTLIMQEQSRGNFPKVNALDSPAGLESCGGIQKILLTGLDDVDIESTNHRGQTPLYWAAENGQDEVVRLLLGIKKSQIDRKDLQGNTPLIEAAWGGHRACVKPLLETGGCDIMVENLEDTTPLMAAVSHGHTAIVKLLLENGALTSHAVKYSDNWKVLLLAAKHGHISVLDLLLTDGIIEKDVRGVLVSMSSEWARDNRQDAGSELLLSRLEKMD